MENESSSVDPFVEIYDKLDKTQQIFLETYGTYADGIYVANETYKRSVRQLLGPLQRMLDEIYGKAEAVKTEQMHSKLIDDLKDLINAQCVALGEDPSRYIQLGSTVDGKLKTFRETSDVLKNSIRILDERELRQIVVINDIIFKINSIKDEMEEVPLLPFLSQTTTQQKRKQQKLNTAMSLPQSLKSASATHSARPASYAENLYSVGISTEDPAADQEKYEEDISEDRVSKLRHELMLLQERRRNRATVVSEIANDIVRLWKEDSHLPSSNDESLTHLERQLVHFAKNPEGESMNTLGVSHTVLNQLAEKKQELVVAKEARIRSTLEMSRRLKLIEDREFLLDAMKKFEARAKNPARLFGESGVLTDESSFRYRAYPRLLLIEAVLRPALVLYKERHRVPFTYQDQDYLELMDKQLKMRSIPRDLFPLAPSGRQAHRSRPGDLAHVSATLGHIAEEMIPDFARVLELSTTVTNIVAERVLSDKERFEDGRWMETAPQSAEEQELRRNELKLLQLGWQLPENFADSHHSTRRAVKMMLKGKSVAPVPPKMIKNGKQWPLIPQLITPERPEDNKSDTSDSAVPPIAQIEEKPVPPPVNLCPMPPAKGAELRRNPLDTPDPGDVIRPPTEPRILKETALIPFVPSFPKRQRVKINSTQIQNIRAPKLVPWDQRASARKVKEEFEEAFKYKPPPRQERIKASSTKEVSEG